MTDRPIVAIDDHLSHMRQLLKSEGYDVVSLRHAGSQPDAIVVSGMDTNIMGMTDTASDAALIEATGLSDQEIVERVRRVMGLKG